MHYRNQKKKFSKDKRIDLTRYLLLMPISFWAFVRLVRRNRQRTLWKNPKQNPCSGLIAPTWSAADLSDPDQGTYSDEFFTKPRFIRIFVPKQFSLRYIQWKHFVKEGSWNDCRGTPKIQKLSLKRGYKSLLYTSNCNIRYIVFPTTETLVNHDGTHSFALVPRLKRTSTTVKSVN